MDWIVVILLSTAALAGVLLLLGSGAPPVSE